MPHACFFLLVSPFFILHTIFIVMLFCCKLLIILPSTSKLLWILRLYSYLRLINTSDFRHGLNSNFFQTIFFKISFYFRRLVKQLSFPSGVQPADPDTWAHDLGQEEDGCHAPPAQGYRDQVCIYMFVSIVCELFEGLLFCLAFHKCPVFQADRTDSHS